METLTEELTDEAISKIPYRYRNIEYDKSLEIPESYFNRVMQAEKICMMDFNQGFFKSLKDTKAYFTKDSYLLRLMFILNAIEKGLVDRLPTDYKGESNNPAYDIAKIKGRLILKYKYTMDNICMILQVARK